MRYFLDTEFNGFGGDLLSLALVPDQGDREFYVVLPLPDALDPWVERHVVPYLSTVPDALYLSADRVTAAHELAAYLSTDPDPLVIADWPEDIALLCRLLLIDAREIVDVARISFEFRRTPGFSTARNSRVPHNALHDARALRDFMLEAEDR